MRPRKPKKPDIAAIRAVQALSTLMYLPGGMATACNICGEPSSDLRLWREHDEHDLPIQDDAHLVYIGHDHDACMKRMKDHPRLYAEEMGRPGTFPICGPCAHRDVGSEYRDGFACRHPKLRANGGPGLLVNLRPLSPPNTIICPPPTGPKARAEGCEGLGQDAVSPGKQGPKK